MSVTHSSSFAVTMSQSLNLPAFALLPYYFEYRSYFVLCILLTFTISCTFFSSSLLPHPVLSNLAIRFVTIPHICPLSLSLCAITALRLYHLPKQSTIASTHLRPNQNITSRCPNSCPGRKTYLTIRIFFHFHNKLSLVQLPILLITRHLICLDSTTIIHQFLRLDHQIRNLGIDVCSLQAYQGVEISQALLGVLFGVHGAAIVEEIRQSYVGNQQIGNSKAIGIDQRFLKQFEEYDPGIMFISFLVEFLGLNLVSVILPQAGGPRWLQKLLRPQDA